MKKSTILSAVIGIVGGFFFVNPVYALTVSGLGSTNVDIVCDSGGDRIYYFNLDVPLFNGSGACPGSGGMDALFGTSGNDFIVFETVGLVCDSFAESNRPFDCMDVAVDYELLGGIRPEGLIVSTMGGTGLASAYLSSMFVDVGLGFVGVVAAVLTGLAALLVLGFGIRKVEEYVVGEGRPIWHYGQDDWENAESDAYEDVEYSPSRKKFRRRTEYPDGTYGPWRF